MIRVLYVYGSYAVVRVVDIEDKSRTEYILNLYEGAYKKHFVRCFDALRHCEDYKGCFVSNGCLCALFRIHDGLSIDDVFYRGAKLDWQTRVFYAEELFHRALYMVDYPMEVACASLLSDNIIIRPKDEQLCLNFAVVPMPGMCEREMLYLLCDQIQKVFVRRWDSPKQELVLVDTLARGGFCSVVALYAYWKNMKQTIVAQHQAIDKKNWLTKRLYFLFQRIGYWFTRRRTKS